jgi:hypothetical protein
LALEADACVGLKALKDSAPPVDNRVDDVDFLVVVLKIETNLPPSGLFSARAVLKKLLMVGKVTCGHQAR